MIRKAFRIALVVLVLDGLYRVGAASGVGPVAAILCGWALVAYLVSRAWPAIRRDVEGLRSRSGRFSRVRKEEWL